MTLKSIKIELLKEFASKLKEEQYQSSDFNFDGRIVVVDVNNIDRILEEMIDSIVVGSESEVENNDQF